MCVRTNRTSLAPQSSEELNHKRRDSKKETEGGENRLCYSKICSYLEGGEKADKGQLRTET